MGLTLGLDIGSSSLGWAVVDEQNQKILGTGVRVFPGAADNVGTGKEAYRNAVRREKRQARRQTYRKRQRRIALLEAMIPLGMCPLSKQELMAYKRYEKGKKQEFPGDPHASNFNQQFADWLKLNPYALRDRALKENISREELGRIFYHIIHHRGFKSGRKSRDDGALYKGKYEIIGIDETKNVLSKFKTLGSFLNSLRSDRHSVCAADMRYEHGILMNLMQFGSVNLNIWA